MYEPWQDYEHAGSDQNTERLANAILRNRFTRCLLGGFIASCYFQDITEAGAQYEMALHILEENLSHWTIANLAEIFSINNEQSSHEQAGMIDEKMFSLMVEVYKSVLDCLAILSDPSSAPGVGWGMCAEKLGEKVEEWVNVQYDTTDPELIKIYSCLRFGEVTIDEHSESSGPEKVPIGVALVHSLFGLMMTANDEMRYHATRFVCCIAMHRRPQDSGSVGDLRGFLDSKKVDRLPLPPILRLPLRAGSPSRGSQVGGPQDLLNSQFSFVNPFSGNGLASLCGALYSAGSDVPNWCNVPGLTERLAGGPLTVRNLKITEALQIAAAANHAISLDVTTVPKIAASVAGLVPDVWEWILTQMRESYGGDPLFFRLSTRSPKDSFSTLSVPQSKNVRARTFSSDFSNSEDERVPEHRDDLVHINSMLAWMKDTHKSARFHYQLPEHNSNEDPTLKVNTWSEDGLQGARHSTLQSEVMSPLGVLVMMLISKRMYRDLSEALLCEVDLSSNVRLKRQSVAVLPARKLTGKDVVETTQAWEALGATSEDKWDESDGEDDVEVSKTESRSSKLEVAETLGDVNPDTELAICLRRHVKVMPDTEIRAFVYNRKVTALCQTQANHPVLWRTVGYWERAFHTTLAALYLSGGILEALPFDDCILDLWLNPAAGGLDEAVQIIEVNAFGTVLFNRLYDWGRDADLLYRGLTGCFNTRSFTNMIVGEDAEVKDPILMANAYEAYTNWTNGTKDTAPDSCPDMPQFVSCRIVGENGHPLEIGPIANIYRC
eukprot:Clim_evm98s147 gene=Clim_evmTU98s147